MDRNARLAHPQDVPVLPLEYPRHQALVEVDLGSVSRASGERVSNRKAAAGGADRVATVIVRGANGVESWGQESQPRTKLAKERQQRGHVALDDAPEGVVVDAEIALNQSIAGGDDEPPGYLGLTVRTDSGTWVAASPINSRLRRVAS